MSNINAPTVGALLDRYQRETMPALAPRTQIDYRRHVIHLKRWFGDRIADELRPKDFGPFLDVRKGKIQRVRQLAVLSACFTQAVSVWYVIERNVLRDVKRPKSKPRDRYVTDAEYEACKAPAPLRVRLAMELALLTGQRQGDIIAMRWTQIQGMEIHVTQAKTGKKLAIQITPAVEAVLDRCWQLPVRGEYVLSKRDGGHYTSEGFRACWQRTIRQYVKGGGARFTFHDLRAKSASDSETIDAAYQRLGHTSMSMTRRSYDRGVRKVMPLH